MNTKTNKKTDFTKSIFSTLYALIIIALFAGVIGMHKGTILGQYIHASSKEKRVPAKISLEHIKNVFPEATGFQKHDNRLIIYAHDTEIGWGLSTSPTSDAITGYAAAVPVLIGFDRSDKVVGLTLLENAESPDFIERVFDSGLMESWNNFPIQDVLNLEVDAVTGATLSSDAIIKTVRHSIGSYLQKPIALPASHDWRNDLKTSLGIILFILAVLQFFFPKRLGRFRLLNRVLVVLILGFWSGTFLSMSSFYNWTINGINLPARLFIFIILITSFVMPLVTGKAFYCIYLCPYGASQDLLGKLRKGVSIIPKKWDKFLSKLREKIFAALMVLLLSGVSFDLTNIEPFSAFLFKSAALPVIILAVLFLILSIFVPRPWCRYACPTGHFFEIIRKVNKS